MGLLGMLARAWLLRRLFGGGRRRGYGYGHRRPSRARGRTGFFGPVPYYSTRTRRGSRVTVGGCCLPIPLGFVLSLGAGLWALLRR